MKNKRVLKKYLAAILSGLVLITIPSGCAFASAASQTGNPVTGRNAESSPMLTYTKDDPAARESNFYNPEYGECSKILCDEDTENDSKRLQDMIDEVAESGGGKVTIQSGVYYLLNVQMKSNVHILIQDGTVLNLCKESPAGATRNSTIMFTMGGCGKREESECVKNASIEALGENIKVDLTTNPADSKRFLQIGNAQNFIVCGLDIYDNLCKFSCITFGVELTDSGNAAACGGIIKDINCYNCAYGYGAIQVQAGINILFKDIYALGGVTLRLESGIPGTRAEDTKPAKTDKIVARNIISEEGNAALMVSPHTADQGTFDARYIKSIGSGFAARIEKGFGKHEGTFSSDSVLKDVYAVYGERAQLKAKHFKYLPAELADKVTEVDSGNPEVENTYIGPSISAVGLIANYDINFDISEVKQAEGFDYQVNGGKLVTLEDARPEN